jgi:predicted cobalt transporter CbtA
VTPRTLLVRGMLAGVLAGLVALLFAYVVGEPQVAAAIRFEDAHAAGGDYAEPVSRTVQSTLGLGVAILVFGAAIGGIFGLAYGFVYGRVGAFGSRGTALGVGALGFVCGTLVPALKYPPNPPGVAAELDMRARTGQYFLMLLIAVLVAVGSIIVGRSLIPRLGGWNAAVVAAVGFIVVCAVVGALLPLSPMHTGGFPPDLLWRFRLAAIGTQAVLWLSLGLVFGGLTYRAERRAIAAGGRVPEPVS